MCGVKISEAHKILMGNLAKMKKKSMNHKISLAFVDFKVFGSWKAGNM